MFERIKRLLGLEARKQKPTTWRTREGKVLKIKEMTTDHLTNVLIHLGKRARYLSTVESYITSDTSNLGDAALDCFNMEFDNLLKENWENRPFDQIKERDVKYLLEVFYVIRDELKSRGEDVSKFIC